MFRLGKAPQQLDRLLNLLEVPAASEAATDVVGEAELGWELRYPSWREGFKAELA